MANERTTQQPTDQVREPGLPSQGDLADLDPTQRKAYTEEGETDTRSEELADRYDADPPAAGLGGSGQGGQRVTGGQYGSESDANETATSQSATHGPSSSSGGD